MMLLPESFLTDQCMIVFLGHNVPVIILLRCTSGRRVTVLLREMPLKLNK